MAFRPSPLARCCIASISLMPLFFAAGCDNVGRAFDRGGGGGGTNPGTSRQVPPAGGITRATRPRVLLAAPEGGGFPSTTPVAVLFDESMNFESLSRSSGEMPTHLIVRAEGTETALPGTYTLLLSGRLLIFTPASPLPPGQTFEIVAGSTVRDVDRQTLSRQGVLASFTTDAPTDAGFKVLATVPPDRETDTTRESAAFVVLTGPPDPMTVSADSLFLQKTDRTKVDATLTFPVQMNNVPDPRVIRVGPRAVLDASTRYELAITDAIQQGMVKLDTGGRDPAATFTTIGPLEPTAVAVGNPTAGFNDRINLSNLQNLMVAVSVPADTKQGDSVTVRLYGDDARETQDVLIFEERSATATADGAGTVSVSFAGALGTVVEPRLKDGEITMIARIVRGNSRTGWLPGDLAAQDTVVPVLQAIGPPVGPGSNVLLTDLNTPAVHGRASERVGAVQLTVGSQTLGLFGSSQDGQFMTLPFVLGRTTAPTPFTLTFSDAAGNPGPAAVNGSIVQRGVLAGNVSGGTLTIVAYDDATLQAIAGADVLIEPGMPQKPAAGRMAAMTDANGTATFTGLMQSSYSITVAKAGYDLLSVLDTSAGYASVPLRPQGGSTATLNAVAAFESTGGVLARIGVNILDDRSRDSFVQTTSGNPNRATNVRVRPSRPLLVTAFAGTMPPVAKPTFAFGATAIGAVSGAQGSNRPPPAVEGGGGTYAVNLALLPSLNAFVNYGSTYAFDLSGAAGFDSANLVGDPTVSVAGSIAGFGGVVYLGPGFASGSGAMWTIDGSYSLTGLLDLSSLGPVLWSSTQAEDSDGNLTRHRAIFADPLSGALISLVPPAGIPTITTPAGTFTGSPIVQVADRLSMALPGVLTLRRFRATDGVGRRWEIWYEDRDGAAGTDSIQLPALAGSGVTGLANGTWSVLADDFLIGAGMSYSDMSFEESRRLELTYARAKAVGHTVQ